MENFNLEVDELELFSLSNTFTLEEITEMEVPFLSLPAKKLLVVGNPATSESDRIVYLNPVCDDFAVATGVVNLVKCGSTSPPMKRLKMVDESTSTDVMVVEQHTLTSVVERTAAIKPNVIDEPCCSKSLQPDISDTEVVDEDQKTNENEEKTCGSGSGDEKVTTKEKKKSKKKSKAKKQRTNRKNEKSEDNNKKDSSGEDVNSLNKAGESLPDYRSVKDLAEKVFFKCITFEIVMTKNGKAVRVQLQDPIDEDDIFFVHLPRRFLTIFEENLEKYAKISKSEKPFYMAYMGLKGKGFQIHVTRNPLKCVS